MKLQNPVVAVEIAVTIVVETDAEAAEDTEEAETEEVETAVKAVMTVDHLVENTRVVTIDGHNVAVLGNLGDGVRKRPIVVPDVAEIRRGVFI